jgi:hypothetical protein
LEIILILIQNGKNFNLNKDDLYNRLYTTYLSFINKDDFEIKHELKEDEKLAKELKIAEKKAANKKNVIKISKRH